MAPASFLQSNSFLLWALLPYLSMSILPLSSTYMLTPQYIFFHFAKEPTKLFLGQFENERVI